jgi:hypothetical protein
MQGSIATTFGLIATLVALIAVLFFHARARAGRVRVLRPLAAIEVLNGAIRRGAETGRAVHVSPGAGAVGDRLGTTETVAGLLAAERVASGAALRGTPLIASSGNAVAYLALRGALRQSYQRAGLAQDYSPVNVQLLAHQDPTAYAVSVAGVYERQRLEASQMVGSFGQELLLFSAEGQQRGVPQVIGAANPAAAALAVLSSDGPLVGDEIYAVDAYLSPEVEAQGRLLTHDFLRSLVIGLLVIGLLYAIFAALLGLPTVAPL